VRMERKHFFFISKTQETVMRNGQLESNYSQTTFR